MTFIALIQLLKQALTEFDMSKIQKELEGAIGFTLSEFLAEKCSGFADSQRPHIGIRDLLEIYDSGKYREAILFYKKKAELADDANACLWLAILSEFIHEKDAYEAWTKAESMNPQAVDQLKRYWIGEPPEIDYTRLARDRPYDPSVLFFQGLRTWSQDSFKQALELDARFYPAYAGLAFSALAKSQRECTDSNEAIEEALVYVDVPLVLKPYFDLDHNPNHPYPHSHLWLGLLHLADNNPEKADENFSKPALKRVYNIEDVCYEKTIEAMMNEHNLDRSQANTILWVSLAYISPNEEFAKKFLTNLPEALTFAAYIYQKYGRDLWLWKRERDQKPKD